MHLHKSADGVEQILVKMLYFTAEYLHWGAEVPEQLRSPRSGAAELKCSWFIRTLSWREKIIFPAVTVLQEKVGTN